jgi:hypothetical protein
MEAFHSDAHSWDELWEEVAPGPSGGQATSKVGRRRDATVERGFVKILARQDDTERRRRFYREAAALESLDVEGVPRLIETRACLHSSGPEDHGDNVNHRGEAGVGLFVARGDASKRLDGTEEVFDEVAPLVLFRVMRGVSSGPLAHRNDRLDASAGQALAQPAGIECLVADNSQAGDAGHENVKAGDVVTLARQEHEAHQIAKRIDERRNLRGQAAARLADGLILSPPFAPVPC